MTFHVQTGSALNIAHLLVSKQNYVKSTFQFLFCLFVFIFSWDSSPFLDFDFSGIYLQNHANNKWKITSGY